MVKVNLREKFALITEHWRPKVVAELNGQEVKLVKFQGPFVWHRHEREDEMFLGVRGRFRIEFHDRTVELGPGEFIVVLTASNIAPLPTKRPRCCCSSRPQPAIRETSRTPI
jgi:hypothetical protein